MHIVLIELKFFTILNWIHSNLKIDAILCVFPVLYEVHREGDCDLHLISFKTIPKAPYKWFLKDRYEYNIIPFWEFLLLLCFELYCETHWVFFNLLKIIKKQQFSTISNQIDYSPTHIAKWFRVFEFPSDDVKTKRKENKNPDPSQHWIQSLWTNSISW